MCNEPYVPKVNSASKISEAATYTSPFGEDESETIRPQTRAKARTHQRTPYSQSQSSQHIKRPRSRKKPAEDQTEASGTTSFQMFLSLPNTPDTEDPLRTYPHLMPGLSSESYI